ncbi:hypothetical protein [Microlunatus ginsengisoli]
MGLALVVWAVVDFDWPRLAIAIAWVVIGAVQLVLEPERPVAEPLRTA